MKVFLISAIWAKTEATHETREVEWRREKVRNV